MGARCQSCGMPFSQDPAGGGTEADGAKSAEYCSYCYQEGAFTQPDMSAAEMQAFCVQSLRQNGMNGFVAWLLTRGIPKLGRWR